MKRAKTDDINLTFFYERQFLSLVTRIEKGTVLINFVVTFISSVSLCTCVN